MRSVGDVGIDGRIIPVGSEPKAFGEGELSLQERWYAGNIFRIFACTAKGNRVILLHGVQKKSQKTRLKDLEIAEQRMKRYFQRHGYL